MLSKVRKEDVLAYIQNLDALPSLPMTMAKLLKVLQSENKGLSDAVPMIRQDPGLVTRLLGMANSALYGAGASVNTAETAVMRLGRKRVRELCLTHGVMGTFNLKVPSYDAAQFWRRSLSVAFVSEALAKRLGSDPTSVEHCFTAGLVHDLGVLALLQQFPEAESEALALANREHVPLGVAERATFGVGHEEVGFVLCQKWGLPPCIAAVARHHHGPSAAEPEFRPLVQCVHVATYICVNRGLGDDGEVNPAQICPEAWSALGLEVDLVPQIVADAEEAAAQSELVM